MQFKMKNIILKTHFFVTLKLFGSSKSNGLYVTYPNEYLEPHNSTSPDLNVTESCKSKKMESNFL